MLKEDSTTIEIIGVSKMDIKKQKKGKNEKDDGGVRAGARAGDRPTVTAIKALTE